MAKPGRKPGLTVERHKEIGKMLNGINQYLTSVIVEFANAYPRSGNRGKAFRELCKAEKHLGIARSCAEDLYVSENPDTWETSTYYGGPKTIKYGGPKKIKGDENGD